jgi:TonB family protein
MNGTVSAVRRAYHEPLWGRTDAALRRSLAGSGALGLLLLAVILLAPALPPMPVTFEQVPERIARLILEKPQPAPPSRQEPARTTKAQGDPAPAARPAPEPAVAVSPAPAAPARSGPARRQESAPLAPDRGVRGREQAGVEVAANLQQVSGSLDKAIGDLARALPRSAGAAPVPGGRGAGARSRDVRAARSGGAIDGVGARTQLGVADLGGSGLSGGSVSIAGLTDFATGAGGGGGGGGDGSGGGGGGGGSGSGSGGGGSDGGTGSGAGESARSNASLLAVVRRYAAGIQFCYENELKRDPGLRGKLVFSLTVDAAGRVTDVSIVQDALGAAAVAECSLAQIREWRFPAVAGGLTTFRAPFVFTPPQ